MIVNKLIKSGIIMLLFLLIHAFITVNMFPENPSVLPEGFVDLSEFDSTIVLDMRYAGNHNFTGTIIDGYECAKCLLTRRAAEALSEVQKELKPFSLSLKVYDCYRPARAVSHFVRWTKNFTDTAMKAEFYPKLDKSILFKEGYIAEKSSHSRGSTVDLTIIPIPVPIQPEYTLAMKLVECTKPLDERYPDNSIDMGCGFDCFDIAANTENPGIVMRIRINRLLLKTLMEKHGFKNYPLEWWHYTLDNEPFPDIYFDFPVK